MRVRYKIALGVLIVLGASIVFKLLIGGSTIATLTPEGPIASQQRDLISIMVLVMLIVAIPMLGILFAFAWKYKAGNPRSTYDPDRSHGVWSELAVWVILAVIVAILMVLAWQNAYTLDPYSPIRSATPPLTIQVVALEWKWLFIYPEQNIATVNFIEFPERTPLHFELTADAPMSSFWIPQLGSQIYAMATMQTQLNLMASTTGEFTGKDTEINGAGYAGMTFVAKSVSRADFDDWVRHVKQASGTLDLNTYNTLSEPSENNPPAYYSSVESTLFDSIMMKFIEPASTGSSSLPQASSGQMMPEVPIPGMNM